MIHMKSKDLQGIGHAAYTDTKQKIVPDRLAYADLWLQIACRSFPTCCADRRHGTLRLLEHRDSTSDSG